MWVTGSGSSAPTSPTTWCRSMSPTAPAGRSPGSTPTRGVVTVDCDDRRTVALRPAVHEKAQPLRLGYAGHALKLQGGQAEVVLVLPGSWQSAYSMATRCVQKLHVYLDTQTQQTGAYRDADPVRALGERWTCDAKKRAATSHLDRPAQPDRDEPTGRWRIDDDLAVAPP